MYSGCGGLDLGLIKAGFNSVWACDSNPDACETYRRNIGDIIQADISVIEVPKVKGLDLLVSGFPCQPFSSAGNRKGVDDYRGLHFLTTLKFCRELSPKIVMIENVRGLLSAKYEDRLLIDVIIESLRDMGYHTTYKLLNFSHFGVPQIRTRVILVGTKNKNHLEYVFPKMIDPVDLSIKATLRGLSKDTPNQTEIMRLNPQALKLGKFVPEGGSWKDIATQHLPDRLKKIRANMKEYGSPVIYRRCSRQSIMSTVTAAFKPENAAVWHPWKDRIFTVREIARFQSFPDDFVFYGRTIKSKYEQIGNAVPPLIGLLFGKQFIECLSQMPRSAVKQKSNPKSNQKEIAA
jgi:DNA (cytosine-5)-methyltransferase 1